ncbi:MAG: MbnP family protein [Flavobacteriales bacterium]
MCRYTVASILILVLGFSSCKKDIPADQVQEKFGNVLVRINNVFGERELKLDSVYNFPGGERIRFSNVSYFIGKLRLKQEENDISVPEPYILSRATQPLYSVGKMKTGMYEGIKFDLGLDSLTNHSDPSLRPPGHPLGFQLQSMHWGWNTGYIFLMIEGTADVSGTGEGPFDRNILYHVGGNLLYRPDIELPNNFEVKADQDNVVEIRIDFGKVFDGVNLNTQNLTMTFDNYQLARLIFDNFRISVQNQ